ncbi:hypothetical protein [Spongiactinospora sp. TRM90649]|uniref:hypothetical protein n=1 Tax=Spongiactinospora sp. TRM90649 TaxID=3031114 RepID=UPI0023F797A1|nr:hypothetical protein [Spongiactinospora sp. TRM90649]MDF5758003.1 hypothetical protein [Spongiactinospora sp. TRM90649]
MRFLVAATAVAGALLLAPPALAEAAPSAASLTCGDHIEKVPGGQEYERKFFYGNCSNTAVKINIWYRVYSFQNFDKQVCVPVRSDTQIGHTLNYALASYYVKDTAGSC